MEFFNVIRGTQGSYTQKIKQLKHAIDDADAVVIGAGEGFIKASERGSGTASDELWSSFRRKFFDFTVEYGIQNVRAGLLYPFMSPEERWAWLSRVIWWKKYEVSTNSVYKKLLALLSDKNYFVITTEPDNLFVENGFSEERIFEMEGSYSRLQCDYLCENYTFPNYELIEKMMESQGFRKNGAGKMVIPEGEFAKTRIASELVPVCPVCGGRVSPNISLDNELVKDDSYYIMNLLYDNFLIENREKKVLYLELGVSREGVNDIQKPFWDLAGRYLKSTYVNINLGGTYCPANMKNRAILIEADIRKVIKDLTE